MVGLQAQSFVLSRRSLEPGDLQGRVSLGGMRVFHETVPSRVFQFECEGQDLPASVSCEVEQEGGDFGANLGIVRDSFGLQSAQVLRCLEENTLDCVDRTFLGLLRDLELELRDLQGG